MCWTMSWQGGTVAFIILSWSRGICGEPGVDQNLGGGG